MRIALVPLMALLFIAAAPASDDEPLPGRDGHYQFETFNLEGTIWQGRLIPEADMIVRFERGGVLYYKYTNGGVISRAGSWKQTGSTVYLETNKKYAEYTAVIRGQQMIGEAHNIRPFQWKWEMKRLPASTLKDDPEPGNGGKP
jgi:hypothetical protein